MINKGKYSVIIPAAGYSERMGVDKLLLKREDGITFISHLIDFYAASFANPIIVVVNRKSRFSQELKSPVRVVINDFIEKGRTFSIKIGIEVLPEGIPCFIHNIDNPHVDSRMIRQMLSEISDDSYCVPIFQGRRGHPVLLGRNIVSYIRSISIFTDLREVLSNYKRIEIQCNTDKVLLNINTPDDYRKYLSGSD
jgi:molybdenum cofactor cytidylyltransferase